jgi:hypothetical protein
MCYSNISRLENDDMDMQAQMVIAEKRGEYSQAEYLRQIIVDEFNRLKRAAIAKRRANNVLLIDEDF